MPTTTDPSDNSNERHQKSRLEAEIEEILERAERENPLPLPIPFEKPRRRRTQYPLRSGQLQSISDAARKWVVAAPLITAYMFAILAFMFSDISPLITHIAVSLAVGAVFWPILEHYRNRGSGSEPSKMWRGRNMAAPPSYEPSPWEQLRRWLRNRRLLP